MNTKIQALVACGLLGAASLALAIDGAGAPASAASAVKRAGHAVAHGASEAATATGHAASEAATATGHAMHRAAHKMHHAASAASE